MDSNEMRELGKQIARDVAAGLMAATAAGAREFTMQMQDAARASQADGLLEAAQRIEDEQHLLTAKLLETTGPLKRLALQQRLAQLAALEQRLCDEVAPTLPAPIETAVATHRRDGRRFTKESVALANGHAAAKDGAL